MRAGELSVAGEAELLGAADVEDGADLDYFDVEDLGKLRRRVRRAIEDTARERELYQEIVAQYIQARRPSRPCPPRMRPSEVAEDDLHVTLIYRKK
jgi:hypothetical protein